MHKPNNLLESDVREQLGWDPMLDDIRIVVNADDGRVTLSGAVETVAELELASEDAWDVGGVKAVDNQMLVGRTGAAIADADIATNCAAALDADKFVPHGAVTVVVADGWVTLTGEVRHHHQRQAAHHAVGRVPGVLDINDQIALTDAPIPTDVADRIKNAFGRSAIVDSSRIEVSNAGHIIYLDGTTDSRAAMNEAVDTAWNAPGVTDVINRLVIS